MTRPGCGDNSCMFGPSGGMGTNGGCSCLEGMRRDREARLRVQTGVIPLRAERDAARRAAVLCADALDGVEAFTSAQAMDRALAAQGAVPADWRTT